VLYATVERARTLPQRGARGARGQTRSERAGRFRASWISFARRLKSSSSNTTGGGKGPAVGRVLIHEAEIRPGARAHHRSAETDSSPNDDRAKRRAETAMSLQASGSPHDVERRRRERRSDVGRRGDRRTALAATRGYLDPGIPGTVFHDSRPRSVLPTADSRAASEQSGELAFLIDPSDRARER